MTRLQHCLTCQKDTEWRKCSVGCRSFLACGECQEEILWRHRFKDEKCDFCQKAIGGSYPHPLNFYFFPWSKETKKHTFVQNMQNFARERSGGGQLKKGLIFYCFNCAKSINKKFPNQQKLHLDYQKNFQKLWEKEIVTNSSPNSPRVSMGNKVKTFFNSKKPIVIISFFLLIVILFIFVDTSDNKKKKKLRRKKLLSNKNMKIINRPKGTQDIYPPRSLLYQKIAQIIQEVLVRNNFQLIILPTYEYVDLFNSSLDSTTDIIHKEMFTFTDRKKRNLALRPEGTISTARLILQNRLFAPNFPLKLYYWANMFRYERPQKGRHREFWQLGVELVATSGVWADYQILKLVQDIFETLGIKQFTCNLNYLGSKSTQERYKRELKNILTEKTLDLCEDCHRKSQDNPLRILDCELCRKKFSFPAYQIAWSEEDKEYWKQLNQILVSSNFPYQCDYHLVRGLDYYTGLVFEVDLEQEKALLGGGRYDQLFQQLGEIDLPAAGFAIGIDRLVSFCEEKQLFKVQPKIDIFFLVLDSTFYSNVWAWKKELENSFLVDYSLNQNKKTNLAKIIAHYQPQLLVRLDEKSKKGEILIKDCQKKEKFSVIEKNLVEWVRNYLKKE